MGRIRVNAGGGLPAILYTFRKAWEAGGWLKFFLRMSSKNACKTCALGMGGQKGGMVNEAGHFPEFCKKSVQAQAGDMTGTLSEKFFADTPIQALAAMSSAQLEALGRLAFPVIAEPGDTRFRRISWDKALARTTEAFREADPHRVFFYSSGRSSNEAAFLLQLVARAYGTPNIHNCSFYCHQASGVALNQVYGSGTASVILEDLDQADLALVIGANPASNHPRLITKLVDLRKRGGRVIVINPVKELGLVRFRIPSQPGSLLFGSTVSDLYLQPRVGSDIAVFKLMLKGLIDRGALDPDFIENHTEGWGDVLADIRACDEDALLAACGLFGEEVSEAVRILALSQKGIFMWAMGLTHHAHGVDNILALANLALARGWLGKPGCGLLPIRGHSNVQGVGSVGVTPVLKESFARRMEQVFGITVPREPGQDTYASMMAAHRGDIQVALLLGGNLFASNPDRRWAGEAMRRIPLTVSMTTKLNEGHVHGRGQTTLLLPVLARDEESEPTTQESMFNYVRLSDGGKPAIAGEIRSEVAIVSAIAQGILPEKGFDWSLMSSHQKLREAISEIVPGLENLKTIAADREEFQIPGRTFHEPRFATATGKARFHVTPLPDLKIQPDEFVLMTLRSEGQFNTVVYEEQDLYRGNERRDVVMLSETDAQRLNLSEGDPVMVETEAGQMRVVVSITEISPGSLAMYYPEANALVPQVIDSRSKTPAFKSIAARVKPL